MPKILLAAHATGIGLAYFYAPMQVTGLCIATGVLFLLWLVIRNSRWAWLPFLGMLCLAGFVNAHQQLAPPAHSQNITRYADKVYVLVEAIVESVEQRDDGSYKVLVKALAASPDSVLQPANGKLLLFVKQGKLDLQAGQVIRWRSRLRTPARYGSPGEFDYPLYLASQNVYVTASVPDAEQIVRFANHPGQEQHILADLRQRLSAQIRTSLPGEDAPLVESLLLGMRAGITPHQRQLLADSGIAHLFAISGLHFGLLALFFYQLGKYLYSRSPRLMLWQPPQRIIPLIILVPLSVYLILTGNAWATRRAFLMVAFVALLSACNRKVAPTNLLSTVALGMLICSPLALFQPGFQLSFLGVLGILLWLPQWQSIGHNLHRFIRLGGGLFLTTLAATIATAPAIIWHFHQLSPAALVTNLLAVPLIAWIAVPAGLSGLAISFISMSLAEYILLLVGFVVSSTLNLVKAISTLSILKAFPLHLSLSELVVLLGILSLLLPLKNIKRPLCLRACVLLTTLLLASAMAPASPDFRVTALSVGQGDATLISIEGGTHYLADGGGLPGSRMDPGKALIAPALGRMGVDRIDGVIATHSHPDHCLGLAHIIRSFPVKTFYHAADIHDLPMELQAVLTEKKVPSVQLDHGWHHIYAADTGSLHLFVPDQKAADINDRSIIAYAGDNHTGALLTADAGEAIFKQLQVDPPPGRVSLLKLPHHGSRHAKPGKYLEWLQPGMAFVSVGRNNPYGFPHRETLAACDNLGTELFRTDQGGLLTFTLIDKEWQAAAYHQGRINPRKNAL